MSKRNSSEVLFPEIVDVKIEEDEGDPLEMINEEQFDNPKTRSKIINDASSKAKRFKKGKQCKDDKEASLMPINIMTCARLDLEVFEHSEPVYKLNCTHCDTTVLLKDWKNLVKHLEKEHSRIISTEKKDENGVDRKVSEDTIEAFTCMPDVAPIVLSNEETFEEASAVDKPIIKTEKVDSDYEDFVDNDGADDDDDYMPDSGADVGTSNKKPKKKKQIKSEDDDDDEKGNYKKNDQIITFTRTAKEIVFGFLEMLKSHPLLWHRRQSIIQRYDRVLLEMASKFHAKFPHYKLSTNEMRLSIYRIKKLYDKAVNPTQKETEAEPTFKTKYPKYFEICTEIEEESKRIAKKCDNCGLSFIDEIDLQVHAFQMHRVGELPFKCQRCNRRFANEAKRAYHEKKDHAEQQFPCLICDKSFDKESRLHSHMSLHVGAKQICEICGKSFDSSYRYRRHMLHHAPPQFKCELCGKMLYEKYTLSEHMKTHYNQRNYACEICGKTFNINNGLQIHRRQVHKVKTQYVWGKKAPTNEQNVNSSPASNMSMNMNTPASVGMTPSTEQNSLLEAPTNPPLMHVALQDRLINDLINLQNLQQQQQQQLQQQQQHSPSEIGCSPWTQPEGSPNIATPMSVSTSLQHQQQTLHQENQV